MTPKNFPISPMKRAMLLGLAAGLAGCLGFGALYAAAGWGWAFSGAITCGTLACHLLLRFLAPALLAVLGQKHPNPDQWWFRPQPWEPALYRALRVKRWNRKALTYSPAVFDLHTQSAEAVLSATCHAELVHELSGALGFLTLLLAVPFGDFWVFLITALLAAAFDGYFVVIQRYNRPRLAALLQRKSQKEGKNDGIHKQ